MDKGTPRHFYRIRKWKREATNESGDYFMHLPIVEGIKAGEIYYVVGRKGTGKTAICQSIHNQVSASEYSMILSLKNFPFNTLYEFSDEGYRSPKQFSSIWYFILLCSVAKMMIKNKSINYDARSSATEVFGDNDLSALSNQISQWTNKNFEISPLGLFTLKFGENRSSSRNSMSLGEKIKIIETFIRSNIDYSTYYIQLDELDEDYKGVMTAQDGDKYGDLLIGLMSACQSVKSFSNTIEKKLFPVIYMRDDIISQLSKKRNSNSQKWADGRKDIIWDEVKLKNLISFRLSKDMEIENPSFRTVWPRLCNGMNIPVGSNSNHYVSQFEYMIQKTHFRPRDVIVYLSLLAEHAIQYKSFILSSRDFVDVEPSYSLDFKEGLENEISGIIPEISEIFECFSHFGKKRFILNGFREHFNKELNLTNLTFNDAETVLKILHQFNIIGSRVNRIKESGSHYEFLYQRNGATLNTSTMMQLHRGLYGALSL